MRYAIEGESIETDGDAFWIAPSAVVIGRVRLGRNVSIWWNAVVRGDAEAITIGDNTNVQDGSVLHADEGFPLILGAGVTVGHMVMLHGCIIGDNSLIGIGSVILNGARIGRNCIVGAKALIPEGKQIPDNSMVMGVPGKVIRTVTAEHLDMNAEAAAHYVDNLRRYKAGLVQQG